jgi:S1-C subfamily serine protease
VIDDPRQNDYFVWIPTGSFQKPVKALVAQVLAADPYTDLAVLKVAVEGLSPFPLADVEQIQPGDAILAVGDPFALVRAEAPQVVSGTIKRVRSPVRVHSLRVQEGRSNLDKETLHHYGTMMETSCPVPSGTSGSAILDRNGNWIGMAVSLAAEDGKEHPSGLAMTVDATFQRVARKLSEGGLPMFGFLGIQPEEPSSRDAQSGLKGARVVSVVRGMPGDVAGLQEEDLIVSVGGREIRNRSDLFRELSSHEADAIVPIQVMRRTGSTQTETLTLKARLSKKYVAEVRPSYSLHVEPQWRGLRVEYVTALPSEMMRLPRATAMPLGLAVKSVDPASGAWKAGLRPGIVIVGVEGEVLHTPEEFHTAVARRGEGPVRLRVLGAVHGLEEILVEDK